MSNLVKNPARFVGCRYGFGQIIAIRFWIRFQPEFRFRSHTATGKGTLQISKATVSDVWTSWVDVMYNKFMAVSGNKLPSLAKCKLAMPACFAAHPNTRVILDCTEVGYYLIISNNACSVG